MRLFSLLLSSILFIPLSLAHSDGLSFEEKIGDVLVDIGFGDALPVEGSTLTYSFDLFNISNPDAYAFEPFTEVHVMLFRDGKEVLSEVIPNNGTDVPSLPITYTDAGDYTMQVIYMRSGKERIATPFHFRVNPAPAGSGNLPENQGDLQNPIAILAMGLIGFAILGLGIPPIVRHLQKL